MERTVTSRPVWGAWVEIGSPPARRTGRGCRAPYGARGLKYFGQRTRTGKYPVAPRMGRVG